MPKDTFIREKITVEIENAICSAFDILKSQFDYYDSNTFRSGNTYESLQLAIWELFENNRRNAFYASGRNQSNVSVNFILSDAQWFRKLDLLEFTICWMQNHFLENDSRRRNIQYFIYYLNERFKSLRFAYRIIGNQIIEITTEEEIVEIEKALSHKDNISEHINSALKLLSQRPDPDFRNSIKESISAVECICREQTGKSSLGDALKELRLKGTNIPKILINAFEKLYVYTNDKSTGIRHALMDDGNTPCYEEAKYMLVTCSAFINYIKTKL